MKHGTIYYKNIVKGLKELIPKIFGEEIPVIVRKPDEDFKTEYDKSVIVQLTGSKYDIVRQQITSDILISKDEGNKTVVSEKVGLPYTLEIQMEFRTKSQNDLDFMVIKFLSYRQRNLVIPVKNNDGEDESVLVNFKLDDKRQDEVEGSTRIFRSIYVFNAYGRINEHVQTTDPMATDFETNTHIVIDKAVNDD